MKELKAFKKVYLKPGESQKVEFSLSEDAFSYYDVDQVSFVVDEGSYDISVGFSADELLLKEEVVIKNLQVSNRIFSLIRLTYFLL